VKIPDSETSDPQSGEKNKIDFKVVENKSINSKNNKTTVKRFYSLDILLVVILTISCAVFVLEPVLSKTVFPNNIWASFSTFSAGIRTYSFIVP